MDAKNKKYLDNINKNLPRGTGKFSVISDTIYVTASIDGNTVRKSTGKQFNTTNKLWIKNQKPKALLMRILGTNDVNDPRCAATLAIYGQGIINEHMKDVGNVEYKKDLQRVFDNYIAKQFGDYELSQITVLDITSFLKKLKRELSVSRAKFIKNVFNLILDFAADQGDIEFNPFQSRSVKKIKFTKAAKKNGKAYTGEEVRLMLENSHGWFKVFLDILFKTGARTGEAMVLKWDDVDLEKGIMHIKRTMHKGVIYEKEIVEDEDDGSNKNHNRRVFLMESTLELLKQYYQVRPHDEWLFVNRYKKPYSEPKNISVYYFKPLLKELGIEYRTIYATRSTYISLMLNSGVSLEQVQANVGHKPGSKVTQAHYHDEDNVDLEKKKTQAQKLEDAFNDTVNNSGKKSVSTDQLKDMSDEELEEFLQEELSDETCK